MVRLRLTRFEDRRTRAQRLEWQRQESLRADMRIEASFRARAHQRHIDLIGRKLKQQAEARFALSFKQVVAR
jgi:hypothetical protein